ncbi:MAG: hypothetical protein ABH824_05440 [Nanoarchaeota archaeon]|nr:hypothetical protein [Nanoarchaeota archaeon]MBU1632706.1 hypothetical protein [Nanoarchaeota archaeon]MBU1876282.1 hypothetical protein [Nanoarchaeota archaeon]
MSVEHRLDQELDLAYETIYKSLSKSREGVELLSKLNFSSFDYLSRTAEMVSFGKSIPEESYTELAKAYQRVKEFVSGDDNSNPVQLPDNKGFIEGLAGKIIKELMKRR